MEWLHTLRCWWAAPDPMALFQTERVGLISHIRRGWRGPSAQESSAVYPQLFPFERKLTTCILQPSIPVGRLEAKAICALPAVSSTVGTGTRKADATAGAFNLSADSSRTDRA